MKQPNPSSTSCLKSLLTYNRPHRVGSTMMLVQPITTTVYTESVFAVVAPKCWNALPAHIRSTESEPLFIGESNLIRTL